MKIKLISFIIFTFAALCNFAFFIFSEQDFDKIITPTETKEEALEKLLEKGCVIDGDNLWISTELYNKHLDYLGSLHKVENTILPQ